MKYQVYPSKIVNHLDLSLLVIFDKFFEKVRVTEKEYQLKKRTGKKTQREQVKELLSFLFSQAKSQDEFLQYCAKYQVTFYQRGKYAGIELEGRKYRLQKIELETEYQNLCTRLKKVEELKLVKSEQQKELVVHQREEPSTRVKKQLVYESDFVKARMEELKQVQQSEELEQVTEKEQLSDDVQKRMKELYSLKEQQSYYEQEFEGDI
jgi:hypothetical protein